jgi:hypothetical protein
MIKKKKKKKNHNKLLSFLFLLCYAESIIQDSLNLENLIIALKN